jgi:hypothetical protein
MFYDLHLYDRPARSNGFVDRITQKAIGWQRSSLAVGGYDMGTFVYRAGSPAMLDHFYNNNLGFRLVERTAGIVTWEGYIIEMRRMQKGTEYLHSLHPDRWHDKVKTIYSYPSSDDTEAGGAYAYNPAANSFKDVSQDFGPWETLAGDAAYRIVVINSDDTRCWGFLGAAFQTTNPDDSIYVYTDVELATAGWNGGTSGKTIVSYTVSNVGLAGSRQDTGWSTNSDATAEYGTLEYIINLPGSTPEEAEDLRDNRLTKYAWPRSRAVASSAVGNSSYRQGDELHVTVAGFWHTLNWTHRASSRIAAASDLVTTVVGESEFVTAGRIETNALGTKIDCDPIAQRRGDLIEGIIEKGDQDGNLWQGGVYADRELIYEQSPTAIDYYMSGSRLLDRARSPVLFPTLVEPGFLLRFDSAPSGSQPIGTSSLWDDPAVGYVDMVEFVAPNMLNLQLYGEEGVIVTMEQQIFSGGA